MFAHESGIHVDGALKNSKTYEAFCPEEVGLTRQIVVGKHSGSHSIKAKFEEYGHHLTDQEADDILVQVKKVAVELKRTLFDKELVFIYEDYLKAKSR